MIKISKITDYAIVVLASLAMEEGKVLTSAHIAKTTTLPEPTVSKVLKLLSKSGIVASVRGASGGYRTDRAARSITMREIITALDGPIAVTSCATANDSELCQIESLCPMKRGWQKLNYAVVTAFDSVTLADMIEHGACARQAG